MASQSDFGGRATVIAVVTPGDAAQSNPQATFIKQIGNLPELLFPLCTIIWICASEETPVAPFEINGHSVIPIRLDVKAKLRGRFKWVQDPFICQWNGPEPYLLIPSSADMTAKELVIQIAAHMGWKIAVTQNWLEGGNMFFIGNTLLVGKDIAYQNGIPRIETWLEPNRAKWDILEKALIETLDVKEIVWVGNTHQIQLHLGCTAIKRPSWQPFFHLDLFILPAGYNEHGNPRLFLGEICNIDHLGFSQAHQYALDTLQSALNEIETLLYKAIPGLELARLPILTYFQENRLSVQSLCNGWVEITSKAKYAYLPEYGRNDRDHAYTIARHSIHLKAERVMKTWGFHLIWVDMDFLDMAREGGALHCAVKILERKH